MGPAWFGLEPHKHLPDASGDTLQITFLYVHVLGSQSAKAAVCRDVSTMDGVRLPILDDVMTSFCRVGIDVNASLERDDPVPSMEAYEEFP